MRELLFSAISTAEDSGSYKSLLHFESILNASSLTDLAREVWKVTRHFGFQHFLYGAHIQTKSGETLQYIFSGYPEQWMQTYLSARYIEIDPIVQHCFCRNTARPLIWDNKLFNTPDRRTLWEEAQSCGIASGLSVPVRGTKGEVALFSAANSEQGCDALTHHVHACGMMYVLSNYLHEVIHQLVFNHELVQSAPPQLTPRERECLAWWVNGKTAWEIGQILNMSERTARFHLSNLKVKLGARNKSQAIARAAKLHLIHP